jgi:hypothetical protein
MCSGEEKLSAPDEGSPPPKQVQFAMEIPEAVNHALKQLALTDRITVAAYVASLMQRHLEEKGLAELAVLLAETGRKRRGRPPIQGNKG